MDLVAEYLEILHPALTKESRTSGKFVVTVDYPKLFAEIEHLKKEYDDYRFVTVGSDDRVSKESYLADIDQMWKDLTELKDNPKILQDLIDRAPKKKNGTFCIGRVVLYKGYDQTGVLSEEEYGWRYYSVRLKTLSNTIGIVYINTEVEHW